MSDQGLTTDTAPPVEAFAPAPAPDLLADPSPEQAVFDRGYVESIRKEAQRYRGEAQRAAQYEVFDQYEDQDRQVWIDLARTWAEDPSRAAQVMQSIARGVLGEPQQEPEMTDYQTPPIEAPSDDELTPSRVKELIEETFRTRDERAAEQAAIDNVMSEVREHGYDPNTAEGFMVLWNANNQTNGDIAAAAEMVKGYRQSIIDDYVQGRSSGRIAMPTPAGVQGQANAEPIKNLDDARRAADAFLRERRGA
jgi:uncharacterized protein (UPF0335 family)